MADCEKSDACNFRVMSLESRETSAETADDVVGSILPSVGVAKAGEEVGLVQGVFVGSEAIGEVSTKFHSVILKRRDERCRVFLDGDPGCGQCGKR